MSDEYEKRLLMQELKTQQFEKVINELAQAVKEIKSILSTLATLQVETAHNNKNLETTVSELSKVEKRVQVVEQRAEKGEQAYKWITKGGVYVVGLVILAGVGAIFAL